MMLTWQELNTYCEFLLISPVLSSEDALINHSIIALKKKLYVLNTYFTFESYPFNVLDYSVL